MAHEPAYLERYDEWDAWVTENPEFWKLFCKFTEEVIAAGRTRTSHWLVVNRIRWETHLRTTTQLAEGFKIKNGLIAFAARDFMYNNAERAAGLFQLRPMIGEDHNLTRRECGMPPRD